MSRTFVKVAIVIAIIVVLAFAVPAFGKGGKPPAPETATNNLSFPAIAVDGFAIPSVTETKFTVAYTGDYPGLTADEIAYLVNNGEPETGNWYPQKNTGNVWQADSVSSAVETVTWIDWGDSIESVNPKVGTPTRLELSLFKELGEATMLGYTMGVLEYPSSTNELQGTNTQTYPSSQATVISSKPKLVLQFLGTTLPTLLPEDWTGTQWSTYEVIPISFAPELNVAGKYIFGASEGGWKPANPGYYRITFFAPGDSGVSLTEAYVDSASGTAPTAAFPKVDASNNLTYVDVLVKAKGGGGGKGR